MKNFFKRLGSLILFISSGAILTAQSLSYSSLLPEIQSIQKLLAPDKRTAILNVEIKDTLKPFVTLMGETDLPAAKEQIIDLLNEKKISYVDSVRLLPDAALGERMWGLATISVANIYAKASNVSELVSQVLMGTPVKVLERKNEWLHIQTPEQYIGWIDGSGLQLLTAKDMDAWKKSNRYLFKKLSGYAFDKPDPQSNIVTDLVLCDLLVAESTEKGFLKIRIADGRTGYVKKSDCISFDEWSHSEPSVRNILSIAREMMGMPYLWGGASSKAADCSGFVKLAYYSQGIILARDASQQARYGEKIDITNLDNLQPGDLLFFGTSAQHITHVGMYLDKGDFIHCSGKVYISSIIPGDPKYNPARNKVSACRVIHSLNAEGITLVKNHPWYVVQP